MFGAVSLVLCVTLVLGNTEPELKEVPLQDKIIGGVFTTIQKYPYQLSLEFKGRLACGASLIGDKWALTAAHCTDGLPPQHIQLRAGSSNYERGGQVLKVKQIIQHKSYTPWIIDYDISILELERPVDHPNAKPIELVAADTIIKEGDTGVITGWGLTKENGALSRGLRVVNVPVVSQATCKSSYGESSITERMFCAGLSTGGKDACQGDSGGPFVLDNKLAGIVSWGIGCARPSYPGVYTSIPVFREYIKSITGI